MLKDNRLDDKINLDRVPTCIHSFLASCCTNQYWRARRDSNPHCRGFEDRRSAVELQARDYFTELTTGISSSLDGSKKLLTLIDLPAALADRSILL